MRRAIVAGIVLVLVSGGIARADVRVIDKATARGDYAVATASGNVDRPARLWVKVKARPSQSVDVYWLVVCSKGLGAGSRDGDFTAVTPVKRVMRMPYRHPDSCTVSASAQLSGPGTRIVVVLLARV